MELLTSVKTVPVGIILTITKQKVDESMMPEDSFLFDKECTFPPRTSVCPA